MGLINKRLYSRDNYSVVNSIIHGLKRTCPHCGDGKLFSRYLKITNCRVCKASTGDIRADDLPPYLIILLVGHIMLPMLAFFEAVYHPPLWIQMAVWPSMALLLMLFVLPFIKGSVTGLIWHLQPSGSEQP
jgi:uncharacterized protein (DUF983 family)